MPHRARAGKEIVLVAGNWLRDLDEKEEPGPDFENGKALHLPPSVLHGLARLCLRSIRLGCIPMFARRRCFSILSVHRCLKRYIKRNRARMYAREGEKEQGHGLEV